VEEAIINIETEMMKLIGEPTPDQNQSVSNEGVEGDDGHFSAINYNSDDLVEPTFPEFDLRDTREFQEVYEETLDLAEKVSGHIATMLKFQDSSLEVELIEKSILREIAERFQNFNEGKVDLAVRGLALINAELQGLLSYPATPQGFMDAQFIIDDFLKEQPKSDKEKLEGGLFSQEIIARRLQRLYDKSDFNLRDYEGLTTNTTVSLEHLLKELMLHTLTTGAKNPEELTILDLGAGEGRLAIPLATLGYHVNGIDISKGMVEKVDDRTELFWDGFTGKTSDKLAESANTVFDALKVSPKVENLDDLKKNIQIQQGNFFDIDSEDYDRRFGPDKADAAIVMWHTFGFAGDHEGQMKVLKNIYDNVRPGGIVAIEMPDREFGGYGRAVREYQRLHGQDNDAQKPIPFGALVDAPSKSAGNPTEQNEELETPRYFPSKNEMIGILEDADFNLAECYDYFVPIDGPDGKQLAVLEHLFVAVRPRGKSQKNLRAKTEIAQEDSSRLEEVRKRIAA
jgi:SAM-dependent methyltransferase